ASCDDAAWRPRRGESASWSRQFSIGAVWGCSLRTVGHVAKSQRNLCECVVLNWENACSESHSRPLASGLCAQKIAAPICTEEDNQLVGRGVPSWTVR